MTIAITSALSASPPVALTHARLGHASITRTGTLVASSEQTDFEADSALNALTYERWRPSSIPATWRIDAGSVVNVDYFGIAAHTLGSQGCTVSFEWSDNDAAWNVLETVIPTDDSPIMVLDVNRNHRYWRINITAGGIPDVGVVYIGAALAMQRPIYAGHSPMSLSRRTISRPQKSERGEWLGKSIIRAGAASNINWQHLTPSWYRANFDPFVVDARTYPFFLAWRPVSYNEVGYVWTHEDISPTNMGVGAGLMQVGFSFEGYSAVD